MAEKKSMMEMVLAEGETQIASLGGILLTNMRVFKGLEGTGFFELNSIPVGNVAHSCVRKITYPILIVIAVLCGIAAIVFFAQSMDDNARLAVAGLFVVGAILAVIAYFKTRRERIEITSNAKTVIASLTSGIKKEDLGTFIAAVNKTVAASRG